MSYLLQSFCSKDFQFIQVQKRTQIYPQIIIKRIRMDECSSQQFSISQMLSMKECQEESFYDKFEYLHLQNWQSQMYLKKKTDAIRHKQEQNIAEDIQKYQKTKHTTKNWYHRNVMLDFIFILITFVMLPVIQCSFTGSHSTSNQLADYTIEYLDTTKVIPAGAVIVITFPKQFSAVELHKNQVYSGYDIANGNYCPSDCSTVTITYSAYVFLVNNMFPTNSLFALSYTIFGIRNPPYQTKTNDFTIQVKSADFATTYSTQTIPGIDIVAEPFPSITATLKHPYLWQSTDVTFDITVTTEIDYIEINFPTKWDNESIIDSTLFANVLVTSSTHMISFSKSNQLISINFPPIFSTQSLKVTISSIYTPSSIVDMGQIEINGYNSQGRICKSTPNFYIPSTQLSYDYLRQLESAITYNQVTNKVLIRLKFKLPRKTQKNDKIKITYPSQITRSSTTTDYQVFIGGNLVNGNFPTLIAGQNVIQYLPFSSGQFQPELEVTMSIAWPRSSLTTSNFKIQSMRKLSSGLYSKMEEAQCCSLFIKEKPTLSAFLTVSNNERLKTSIQYSFDLTHQFITLLPTDSIMIQFPSVYQLDISKQSNVCPTVLISIALNSSNIQAPITCTLIDNVLTLSNIIKASQVPTLINVKVNVDNPATPPIENFIIWSQDSTEARIQSNNAVSVAIAAAKLSSVSVGSSSVVTNQQSTYTLSITSIGLVTKNTLIHITVSAELRFYGQSVSCKINSIAQFCSLDSVNRLVKILAGFDLASTSFTVNIDNLINPESLSPVGDFKVEIYDTTGILVENSTGLTGLNKVMTATDTFMVAKMWTDSTVIDAKGNLKFLIATNHILDPSSNYKIFLTLSNRTLFSLDTGISVLTVDGTTVGYSPSNSSSQVSINFIFKPSSAKDFVQLQFTDLYVFQDLFQSSIQLWKQVGGVYYKAVTSAGSVITLQYNLYSVLISDYTVTQQSYYKNQATGQITLKINTISANIQFSYCLIKIPLNYQSTSKTYTYNSTTNTTTITFTIADMLNPTQVLKQPFTFILYDKFDKIIAISSPTNQYFDLKCDPNCRSCKSITENALCGDCYQVPITNMVYFRQTSGIYGICTDHCVAGEYLEVTARKCLPCGSNCSSCVISVGAGSGDPQKCLTCPANTYFLNNRCYSPCPSGYFQAGNICTSCINNCAKCSALNTCSQCVSPFVYYQGISYNLIQVNSMVILLGNCLSSCPLKTIATPISSIPTLNQCLSCPGNCLTCTSTSVCTLCAPSFYLSNSLCHNSCPLSNGVQLYPDGNNICRVCQCAACDTFSYKCTSCSNGLVFDSVKFSCLTSCEDGYFNNNGICSACPNQCLTCDSSTFCKVCKQPYGLYKTSSASAQCLSDCPISTLLSVDSVYGALSCLPCALGCSKCIISSTFCTQCISNYKFMNNLCLASCPANYHDIQGYCKKCIDECDSCDTQNPRFCYSCSQGYYLSNNFCYANCPQGTYQQTSLKKCLSCQSLCETCMNATHCTTCKQGYFLFPNNLCYNTCPTQPIKYYMYNAQCLLCQPQCNGCLNSPVECVTCASSYFYQNQDTNECSTTCIANYFVKGNKCVKCQYPCLECDSTYSSCKSCYFNGTQRYLYEGRCLSTCLSGYYASNLTNSTTMQTLGYCLTCPFPCKTCTQTQCITCESFAYMYKQTCVMDCATTGDMIYEKDTYCTNCLSIPFCTFCQLSQVNQLSCWQCTYPYVLFQSQCLNQCPRNFVIKSERERLCEESAQYIKQKQQIYQQNKPSLPFIYLILFIVISLVIYPLTSYIYPYTYHVGYWIFLLNLLDYILIYVWLAKDQQKYEGEYFDGTERQVPVIVVLVGLCVNLVLLGWIGFGYVIKEIYLKDVRYLEWKDKHFWNFVSLILLILLLGPKSHKLYYSKLFGLQHFAYRIISVEKFHLQDRISFLSCFGDLIIIAAFLIMAFNVFIENSVLFLTPLEILCVKLLMWILLIYDSKKPDRGFFFGDEKLALQQIEQEQEQNLAKLRRVDTDHLIRMIRIKSACFLQYEKHPFGQIQKAQFLSVYNPEDYQDVPKVPLRKIEANIRRGKFRKGRKITIQQKLQRFADQIKPKPKIVDSQQYIHGLIYWKPPKKIKVAKQQRKQQLNEESMLKMLQNKQAQYKEELQEIENIVFQQPETNHHNFRTGQFFFKHSDFKTNNHLNIDSYEYLEQNPSIQQFQDISSQVFKPSMQTIGYDDLMNLNYAKKKHLPLKQSKPQFDDNSMRILYHSPMKKRKLKARY